MGLHTPASSSLEPDRLNTEIGWNSRMLIPLALMGLGLIGTTVLPWLGVVVLLGAFAFLLWDSIPVAAAAYIVLAPLPVDVVVLAHKIYWSDFMAIFMFVAVIYRMAMANTEASRSRRRTRSIRMGPGFLARVFDLFFPASYRWPLVLLLVLSLLSLATALSHSGTVIKLLEYLEFFVVIIGVLRFAGRTPAVWKLYLYALLASASVLSLYGFGQFLFGIGPISHQISVYHVRAESLFGQPNPFGGFVADLFPMIVALIALGPKSLPKRWLTVGLVIITLGIVSSYSRGAWVSDIGAVAMMLVVVLLTQSKRQLAVLGAYAVGIPVLTFALIDLIGKVDLKPIYHMVAADLRPHAPGVVQAAKVGMMQTVATVRKVAVVKKTSTVLAHANPMTKIFSLIGAVIHPHKYYDVQQRFIIWHSAWEAFLHHPWLGVGLGNFHLYIQHHRPKNLVGGIPPMAHNLFLEWGADLGVGGFIAGLWLEWRWLVTAVNAMRQSIGTMDPLWYAFAVGAFGTIVAFIIQNLVDLLIDQGVILPFLLAVALIGYVLAETREKGRAS